MGVLRVCVGGWVGVQMCVYECVCMRVFICVCICVRSYVKGIQYNVYVLFSMMC